MSNLNEMTNSGLSAGGGTLSLDDLEIIANKNKVVPQNEVDVQDLMRVASSKSKTTSKTRTKTRSDSAPSTVSIENSYDHKRHRKNTVARENRDIDTRRQKGDLLQKIEVIVAKRKADYIRLDMTYTLDEIKEEYNHLKKTADQGTSTWFIKKAILLLINGIEFANGRFDPIGVDLEGWGESMQYAMDKPEYDDVLGELIEKYKGLGGEVSPEMKLVFMIASTGVIFAASKKMMAGPGGGLGGLLGKFGGVDTVQESESEIDVAPSKIPEPSKEDIDKILRAMNSGQNSDGGGSVVTATTETKRKRGRPRKNPLPA